MEKIRGLIEYLKIGFFDIVIIMFFSYLYLLILNLVYLKKIKYIKIDLEESSNEKIIAIKKLINMSYTISICYIICFFITSYFLFSEFYYFYLYGKTPSDARKNSTRLSEVEGPNPSAMCSRRR